MGAMVVVLVAVSVAVAVARHIMRVLRVLWVRQVLVVVRRPVPGAGSNGLGNGWGHLASNNAAFGWSRKSASCDSRDCKKAAVDAVGAGEVEQDLLLEPSKFTRYRRSYAI